MPYRIHAIIQARMKSSRLPDKVMLDIDGQPMLVRVIDRVRSAKLVNQVVVATTSGADEDPIEKLCHQNGVDCYRGSLHDVLDRYYQAAKTSGAEIVVRITADCPLIDPGLIDETISALLGGANLSARWQAQGDPKAYPSATTDGIPWDYASTRLPPPWKRTFPIGLDVEVCTFNALEKAWQQAQEQHEREHVMPYLYDFPNRFRCIVADWHQDLGDYRWTVDTPQDLELMREVYVRLHGKPNFNWLTVLQLFQENPELNLINANTYHKDFREVDSRRA